MLGTQEAIRQSQAKEKREEHRARRCNLIVGCVRTSLKGREINGKKIVLRDSKLYIDVGNTSESDESAGHPFAGYYLPYPDSEYEGLVSTITHVAPILNWIYIDKDTYEVKYGVRDNAQPHLTGPFDCTRQDRRLTFEDWEGFVAVEETPTIWSLYFDRDDNGLKGKVERSKKVLEVVLTRQERKKEKEEAQQPKVTDKEKHEQAGDHQAAYIQGASGGESTAQDAQSGAGKESAQPHVLSAADLAKLKIGNTGPSSVSSDHLEGTVSSPTEPWGAASMWSNQEQQAASGAASHLAPFTPSSSIYGDEDTVTAPPAEGPEESTPRRHAYHKAYVEDEESGAVEAVSVKKNGQPAPTDPFVTTEAQPESKISENTSKRNDSVALDVAAGAELKPEHEDVDVSISSHHQPTEVQASHQYEIGTEKHTQVEPIKENPAEEKLVEEKHAEERATDAAQGEQPAEIPSTSTVEANESIASNIVAQEPKVADIPPPVTTVPWPDTPLADQKTSPNSDFQVSHVDESAPAAEPAGSSQEPIQRSENPVEHTYAAAFEPNQTPEEQGVAHAKVSEVETTQEGQPDAKANEVQATTEKQPITEQTERGPQVEVPEEPTPTPVEQKQQAIFADKTPEIDAAELRSTIENLPAWAALPEPYWDAAADTPHRSYPPIEEHGVPDKSEARNFSRPQIQHAEGSPKEVPKPDTTGGAEESAADRTLREQSAPPITMSKEPYNVEDDPTSADTSLVDTSFTSPTPYQKDDVGPAADTTAGKASLDTRSSITLGEPVLEGNRGPTSQAHGKEADGSMQNPSTARPSSKSGWRTLTTRLKMSKGSVLRRSKTSS